MKCRDASAKCARLPYNPLKCSKSTLRSMTVFPNLEQHFEVLQVNPPKYDLFEVLQVNPPKYEVLLRLVVGRIVTFCSVTYELLKFQVWVYMFVKRPDPFPNEVAFAARCIPPFTNVESRLPCAVRIATFLVSVVRKGNV